MSVGALLIGAAAISTLTSCSRMAVKYGAPPAPASQEQNDPTVDAPIEPGPSETADEPEPE